MGPMGQVYVGVWQCRCKWCLLRGISYSIERGQRPAGDPKDRGSSGRRASGFVKGLFAPWKNSPDWVEDSVTRVGSTVARALLRRRRRKKKKEKGVSGVYKDAVSAVRCHLRAHLLLRSVSVPAEYRRGQ